MVEDLKRVPGTGAADLPTPRESALPITSKPPEVPHDDVTRDTARDIARAVDMPGTMQLRPGQLMPSASMAAPSISASTLPPASAIMATVAGGPTQVTHAPPAVPMAHERYHIGHEIARGGMGRVVEATDAVFGRTVALKEALALDVDSLKRFERETKITARLEHPSIVPVHDAGTMLGGAPYYVMRKISGRPLERLVALAETLDERLALVPHMVAASHAIAHAHERGVVHRDIKPSNILVGDLGETIVIDWGLAKMIGEADDPLVSPVTIEPLDSIKTRAGIVYGTPGFMAPEQLRGKPVNERCDVYALGATLYHLLGRKPPHHAKTADEMMLAAAAAAPAPIRTVVAGVPPELATIVDKCLAYEPADRYQNARALAEDLRRFLAGQLVASHHYSTAERARRFVKRNKVPVAAVAATILVLLLAFVRVRGERDRADDAARAAIEEKAIAETERQRAEHELERVTLQQAKNGVETN
ncbi:MAG TPA: serine/threonine-protein kinase, partial [Kofleriaceae bacterium]|nr:serine/threonine-protein kinase [Kofleriaceae bacterium]